MTVSAKGRTPRYSVIIILAAISSILFIQYTILLEYRIPFEKPGGPQTSKTGTHDGSTRGGSGHAVMTLLKDSKVDADAELVIHGVNGNNKVHRGGGGDGNGKQSALMLAWQSEDRVLQWKSQVRRETIRRQSTGTSEAYPCPDKCPVSELHMENTICPMMLRQEAALLLRVLRPESVVFEFGSGLSSLYFSQCVTNWTSIEHHMPWCLEMQTMAPPNVRIKCVPIESEYEELFYSPGRRKWDFSKREFKTYVEAARDLGLMKNSADVVIIDGRARGDCSLEVLPYLRSDSLVLMHDWTSTRLGGMVHPFIGDYAKALAFYDIVELVYDKKRATGLVLLRPKPEALALAKTEEWQALVSATPPAPPPTAPPKMPVSPAIGGNALGGWISEHIFRRGRRAGAAQKDRDWWDERAEAVLVQMEGAVDGEIRYATAP